VQLDNCRLGGLNEVLAVLLLAAKYGKPVCPHAGGIGLCEYAQHVSMIDYLCISGSLDGRMTEHAAHLHEHFLDPIRVERGRYIATALPGFSAEMHAASIAAHSFPDGSVWRNAAA
jgi:L-fuconate dehydratase